MDEQMEPVTKRLNVIINLMLRNVQTQSGDKIKKRELIEILNSSGLDYKEIAQILSTTPSYISSELTQLKKKGRKKNG